jgi:hypothetical protein
MSANEIKFVGFSDAETNTGQDLEKLGYLVPYYNMSHFRAGNVQDYNPSPQASDVLKHLKLFVGVPDTAATFAPLLNLDTYDLYHGCDQHQLTPNLNNIVPGKDGNEEQGSPWKGLPLRFQKVHFIGKVGENGDTKEYVSYFLTSAPLELGKYGDPEFPANEDDEYNLSEQEWNSREWIGGEASSLEFKDRLVITNDESWSFKVKIRNESPQVVVSAGYRCKEGGSWQFVSESTFSYINGGVVYMTWTNTTVDSNGDVDVAGEWSSVLYGTPPTQTTLLSVFRIATTDNYKPIHEHFGNVRVTDVAPCEEE